MTGIVARLQATFCTAGCNSSPVCLCVLAEDAAAEIARLQAGLMKAMQYENKCDQTGKPCREPSKCGCYLEAEAWCEDFIVGGPGRT